MSIRLLHGDCLTELPTLAAEGFRAHAVVCDPPYHLTAGKAGGGFMGKAWDGGDVAFRPETWAAVMSCMRPGAFLVAFGGTRSWHRMTCAIEDAGFEIRDTLAWLYGAGFPKSLDIGKALDKAAGAEREVIGSRLGRPGVSVSGANLGQGFSRAMEGRTDRPNPALDITAPATDAARQWHGYGTALKPAFEPIVLARVPLSGTVAANVLAHGCGGLNIDACRVGSDGGTRGCDAGPSNGILGDGLNGSFGRPVPGLGRFPANVLHDGSAEVEGAFAAFPVHGAGSARPEPGGGSYDGSTGIGFAKDGKGIGAGFKGFRHGDTGSASRFFYSAKADARDRADSKHPTVKPTDLMRWLVQLVTPPGGTVLDPFAGSGSTGLAADQLGMNAVLIEREAEYVSDIRRKIIADAGLFAVIA